MFSLFQYDFFINALYAAVLAAITCGIVGTYIVSKRIVFIGGGLSHASFGGIGLGYYFGFNPILGAAVFAVLSALGIEYTAKKVSIREDSAIAILWAFGMAVGIIFVYITPGYAPNLMSYLFGSILTVSHLDLYLLLGLSILLILFFTTFFKPILYVAFDEDFARTQNIPVTKINYILMSLIALTIVFNIRVVGIILVISLLTLPQIIANLFTKNFLTIILASIVIGLAGTLGGLAISYYLDIPSGATIIFFLVILFLIGRIVKWILSRR
ncbi:MAG: metal ABC transporter permease [Bacteroidetes bacterium]|nr:metal ABC transporter permease [Bacteroidota bacterium]